MLTKTEREFLIELLEKGQSLPQDFKYKLFPTEHREYELAYAGKMRKEDLLANDDGSFPVPLQIEKVFNGIDHPHFADGWRNMVVFGDNLQFLKTIYEDKDPIIAGKIKGRVKLIYIDPPFATTDEFQNKDGAKAYNDKKKGADFVEFLRRRLILAKEILADDGSIYIHLDQKMVNHIRLIMDEIFGTTSFKNAIIWHYGGRMMHNVSQYNRKYDVILYYTKSPTNYFFELPKDTVDFDQYAKSRHEKIHIDEDGNRYLLAPDADMERTIRQYESEIIERGRAIDDVWDIRYIRGNAKERTGYPTQKPEDLIERIIRASTKKGDIVMDFFAGSGTSMSVAEKLERKWIVCDSGKLAHFIMQKRILQIQNSVIANNTALSTKEPAKSFMTCTLGSYDLKAALELEWDKYKSFIAGLFNINMQQFMIGSYSFDGKKDDYPVKIFDYTKFKDSNVDEIFLNDIAARVSKRINGSRIYIISPSTRIDFLTDYETIDGIRFYFLKIPYQMIKELHQKPFQKFRQPQSRNDVNVLDEAIGFSFIRTPSVTSNISINNGNIVITLLQFSSNELTSGRSAEEKQLNGFELLSAVFIDRSYNGKDFVMTDYFFFEDMIKDEKTLKIMFDVSTCGKKMMIVYTDIYGNDFTESFIVSGG